MSMHIETNPGSGLASSLRPLLIDVALPVGGYYLLHDGLGLSLWLSLAISGAVPALRTIVSVVAQHRLNILALLMLVTSVAGIAVSFATGNPRLLIARDSVISSAIAVAILVSVAVGRPLMSAGLKPFMTRGCAARTAAWDRLAISSARFRRLERLFSLIWGLACLADCAARVVGAFALPGPVMVWLGTVITVGSIAVAIVIGGVAAQPIQKMIEAEADAGRLVQAPPDTRHPMPSGKR
jgi:hypothetical protein